MHKRILAAAVAGISILAIFAGCINEGEEDADNGKSSGAAHTAWVNILDFGARGDGETLDTKAINAAIEECYNLGGGTVYFPGNKTYVSGSINLKSNITLLISFGATLLAAQGGEGVYNSPEENPNDQYQDFGHSHWQNSLICGENLTDIKITGFGTIDGAGLNTSDGEKTPGNGNKIIGLKLCRNVVISDLTMLRGGHLTILPTGCENVLMENLFIDANRDGINIDACSNVTVRGCRVNSPYNDAIVPKSSYALGYPRPCENILIEYCHVSGYITEYSNTADSAGISDYVPGELVPAIDSLAGALGVGGGTGSIKFGTESNGGFVNSTIRNCVYENCMGLALESVDGGRIENLTVSGIEMIDVICPIFMRLGNRARGPNGTVPGSIRNININNFTVIRSQPPSSVSLTIADSFVGSIISGIPGHRIGPNIVFDNMTILCNGGGQLWMAESSVPENEQDSPDQMMFDTYMPSYGFYCRHVEGVAFRNINLDFVLPDWRPAIVFEDYDGMLLQNLNAAKAPGGAESVVYR